MSKSAQVTNHNLGEIDLRRLPYSPDKNPLMDPQEVKTRHRRIRSSRGDELMNTATGEISHVSAIHQIEELDESQFVKIFPAGVAAAYGLTKTAQRVFTAVLEQYQRTPMRGGFADYVTLFWSWRSRYPARRANAMRPWSSPGDLVLSNRAQGHLPQGVSARLACRA